MLKFENERIHKIEMVSPLMVKPVPICYVQPKVESNNSCVFIFNGGLGATNEGNLYLNNSFYDNHYFVTYEKSGQGNNQNKPSQFRKKWLIELDAVVDWTANMFPNKKIYLIGESWGSAVALVYYIKHPSKVAGAVVWNMPTKPIDPDKDKKKFKEKFDTAIRQLGAIIFNKPIKLKEANKDYGTISRDPLLVRLMNLTRGGEQNALLTAAVWRFMGPSRKVLLKYGLNSQYNFMYVQSGQDAMLDKKMLPKYRNKMDANHFTYLETGYHILSLEPKEANDLYSIINNFINKKEA